MSDSKSELERTYTVPLSRAWIAPRHGRTKRAVNILREFAEKHMKGSEIKIDTSLNERLWNRGITRPPRRIIVEMKRDEDGVVTISLAKKEQNDENGEAKKVEGSTDDKLVVEKDSTIKPEESGGISSKGKDNLSTSSVKKSLTSSPSGPKNQKKKK